MRLYCDVQVSLHLNVALFCAKEVFFDHKGTEGTGLFVMSFEFQKYVFIHNSELITHNFFLCVLYVCSLAIFQA